MESTTTGVFFGSRDCLADFQQRRRSQGDTWKKRQAPRPPVLIDIDVGFSEQGLSDLSDLSPVEGPLSGGPGPESPQLAMAGLGNAGLGEDRSRVNPLFEATDLDSSLTQSSSGIGTDDNCADEPSEQSPTMDIPSPPRRRPRTPPPATPPPPPPAPATRSPPTPTPPATPSPRTPPPRPPPPVIQAEVSVHAEDKSSKSGINGYHTEQEYDLNESFEEDEATLDFAEEDYDEDDEKDAPRTDPSRSKAQVYREYHGDDYSQYLADDQDAKRKGKKRLKKRRGPKQPDNTTNSASSGEATARKGFKLRLGRMAMHPDPEKGKGFVLAGNNIHNFSFADSKIGNDIQDNDLDTEEGNVRRYEKNPNAGYMSQRRRSSSRWWNKDTLSAQSISSHSDILLKTRRSCSIPDVLDKDDTYSALSDPTGNSTYAAFSDTESSMPDKYTDFESYRKNIMYGTRDKKTKNLWRRISNNFRRAELRGYGENATSNPLGSAMRNGYHWPPLKPDLQNPKRDYHDTKTRTLSTVNWFTTNR